MIRVAVLFLAFFLFCGFTEINGNVRTEGWLAFGIPMRILTVGDSITKGTGSTYFDGVDTWDDIPGFRGPLQNKLGPWRVFFVGSSNTINIATDNSAHMLPKWMPNHYGWSGGEAQEVVALATASPSQHSVWLANPQPDDLIIIMLGTNNVSPACIGGDTPAARATAVTAISSYIDTIDAYDADINIIICTIPPSLPQCSVAIEAYNFGGIDDNNLTKMVADKGKANLFFVDIYSELENCWIVDCASDTVHPNNKGYEIIAEIISQSIKTNNIGRQ